MIEEVECDRHDGIKQGDWVGQGDTMRFLAISEGRERNQLRPCLLLALGTVTLQLEGRNMTVNIMKLESQASKPFKLVRTFQSCSSVVRTLCLGARSCSCRTLASPIDPYQSDGAGGVAVDYPAQILRRLRSLVVLPSSPRKMYVPTVFPKLTNPSFWFQ